MIIVRVTAVPDTHELPRLTHHAHPLHAERRAHSSAVECLLCKEDALGSNPSGSMSSGFVVNRVPYKADGGTMNPDARPMHHSARAGMGRVEHARVTPT